MEHMAKVKNEMIVCCYHPILEEMSPATPWSWKSLIELNEKASGQNVTDIWAPAATMEIVGMYHTTKDIRCEVCMSVLMMVYWQYQVGTYTIMSHSLSIMD